MAYKETPLLRQSRKGYFGVAAHGKDVFEHYAWISQILETLGKDGFLAKGTLQADDEIVWVTELEGKPQAFVDLTPQEQSEVMAEIDDSVSLLAEQANKYLADKDQDFRQRGGILIEIVGPPGEEFIFVVAGRPVIAGWGFRKEQGIPERPSLFAINPDRTPGTQGETVVPPGDQEPGGPIPGVRGKGRATGGQTSRGTDRSAEQEKLVPWWVWAFLALLGLLLLILLLLKSCDLVPGLLDTKVPTEAPGRAETPPCTESPPTTRKEGRTLPGPPPNLPATDEGGSTAEPLPGSTPGGQKGPDVAQGLSQPFPREGQSTPGTGQRERTTPVLPPSPTDRPEARRPLTDPERPDPTGSQRTVKRVSERLIEGTKVLTIDPPDPNATWRISIPASAPAEVLQDKAGHLRFLGSPSWDRARGNAVKIRFSAPAGGRSFTADVIATDSQGLETVYALTVGGK